MSHCTPFHVTYHIRPHAMYSTAHFRSHHILDILCIAPPHLTSHHIFKTHCTPFHMLLHILYNCIISPHLTVITPNSTSHYHVLHNIPHQYTTTFYIPPHHIGCCDIGDDCGRYSQRLSLCDIGKPPRYFQCLPHVSCHWVSLTWRPSAVLIRHSLRSWRYLMRRKTPVWYYYYKKGFRMRSRAWRWSWTLSPEEIMSKEVELGCESWTSFASGCSSTAVQRTLSLSLCPSTAVKTAIAQCTSRRAMARGHRLNTSITLVAVHGLSGLFRAVSAVEPSLFRPPPPPPPPPPPVPMKHPRFYGRKAKWSLWCRSSRRFLPSHGP